MQKIGTFGLEKAKLAVATLLYTPFPSLTFSLIIMEHNKFKLSLSFLLDIYNSTQNAVMGTGAIIPTCHSTCITSQAN